MKKVSIDEIKTLRKITGAGVLDCKIALEATNGDIEKAIEYLRKHGIARAEKKLERETEEGIIAAYIHTGDRLGVLLELNCESSFVAQTPEFKALAKDIAMQIAAMAPEYVSADDVPEDVIEHEKDIYREQAKSEGRPERAWDKIVEGRLQKFYEEKCLLSQPFIKDQSITVEEYIKGHISKFGENIRVRRFVRFKVGEQF
ncbi:translation elongation factor Ts [candidate division bacterium WOR-3 4484_18]|uniref:Elongation factor Ts n=1 Tax=candidate division WOR-3 bacterium 4484_18 TaxID=2020626 RepID=A0A257LWF8_UNCW3|nr:MAG: translation elongation factor Ts [candidate division bacterium WOR-3 4484_18]